MSRHEILLALELNTDVLERKLEADAYEDVIKQIVDKIEKILPSKWTAGYRSEKVTDWKAFVDFRMDVFLEQHKAEIIEAAANKLNDSIKRTKMYKERMQEVLDD